MTLTGKLRQLMASAGLLALMLTAAVSCAVAPQWSLTVTGDPALVDTYTLNQSSNFSIRLVVFHGALGDRAANMVALNFEDLALMPSHRIGGIVLGRAPGGAVTPSMLAPGTYTDVPTLDNPGSAPLLFNVGVTGNGGAGQFCSDRVADFTINAIDFVDHTSRQDTGLAYLDVEFTSRCPTLNGVGLVHGHLVWADPTRRPPQLSTVRGSVWEDLNKNGVRDAGEPGIPGSTITQRFVEPGGFISLGSPQTVDADGNYEFLLPPGAYRFVFALPASFVDPQTNELILVPTAANVGADDALDSDIGADGLSPSLVLAGGQVHGPDGGFRDPATTLEGHAWLDADHDGLRDSNETALAVNVCFYNDFHAPLADHLLGCVAADESGYYSFDTSRAVVYAKVDGVPADWTGSSRDQGADDTIDSDLPLSTSLLTVIYDRGGRRSVLDLGAFPTLATISGVVWDDSNHDGLREADEPRLPGVTLELKSERFTGVHQRVTTDSEGRYTFTAQERDYYVQLLRPSDARFQEYVVSPRGIGSDRSVDSDFLVASLRSDSFVLVGGQNVANLDVGFTDAPRMPIRGRAWKDANGNGLQDGGEARLSGVNVQVFRAGKLFADAITDSNGEYEVLAPVGYRYQVSAASSPLSPTLAHVNGFNDSDSSAIGATFLLTTAAPVIRDFGFFASIKGVKLSDYFPLEVGNRWVFRTIPRGAQVVCSIPRKTAINGVSTALFKCSDGQAFSFTLDRKGLRLHSMRINGSVRTVIGFYGGATADIRPAAPMLLAPATRPPPFTYRGRTTGSGKVVTSSDSLSSRSMPITYTSALRVSEAPGAAGYSAHLRISNDFHAERSNGEPIDLGFGMELSYGVGPTAFFRTSTGEVTAQLEDYFRDQDGDHRTDAKDNCPHLKNPTQTDSDHDDVGDACDLDLDDDRVQNSVDNCPLVWNEDQVDSDANGTGDACTPAP